jgi:hypothetical protein
LGACHRHNVVLDLGFCLIKQPLCHLGPLSSSG